MIKSLEEREKLLEYLKEKYAELNKATFEVRLSEEREKKDKSRIERNPFQKDYARLIHSSSFRRLQGKMQLLDVKYAEHYRNRLTHSIEVSQIARGIVDYFISIFSENLGDDNFYSIKDNYILEFSSLAHDLGNPPFGHYGETVLYKLAVENGLEGFEGNAQTLRILLKLERAKGGIKGLNLTKRSLLSIVKSFNKSDNKQKRFLYNNDYDVINSIVKETGIKLMTLDAQIMDLADEIAYIGHDLEDALNLKFFNDREFLNQLKRERLSEYEYELVKEIFENAHREAENSYTTEEYSEIFRKNVRGNIVNSLIQDIVCVDESGKRRLYFNKYKNLASELKKLIFKLINRESDVMIYEKKGEIILKSLFALYMDEKFNKNGILMPEEYRINWADGKERKIIDYLSAMMDLSAIELYEKYFGINKLNEVYLSYKESETEN